MSLLTFLKRFPDDDTCWAHLESLRWPHGPVCPHCGSIANARKMGRAHYLNCNACGGKFKATHGTALEGTHLPIRSWFTALYLVTASSKGLSSVKLGEHLGVGQKTAWFLGQRIRRMMKNKDGLLSGIVDTGEMYLGGKKRPRGKTSKRNPDDDQPTGRSGSKKAMVTVVTERGGRARAAKGRTHSGRTIANFVFGTVSREGTVLVSDELAAYRWIGRKLPAHLQVKHSKGEYVRKDEHAAATAYTNMAESFNATLKRAWIGVFPWYWIKHTGRYLDQATFRWNARKVPNEQCIQTLFGGSAGRMRWKERVA